MNRNYSIITNFGCHYSCPYCIVKKNDIKVPKTNLEETIATVEELIKNDKMDFLSVSGGGDPLYNFTVDNVLFYSKINTVCYDKNIFRELHTSYTESLFLRDVIMAKDMIKYDRIVYHLRSAEQISLIPKYNIDYIRRVVFVVQDWFSEEKVHRIVEECKECGIDELSFRQRVKYNYEIDYYLHDFLLNGHGKDWHYIQQDDYNNYIVNDKVYKNFSEIGKED